mmetsp:Transcript_5208/g.12422  ORF Transcript_5208/g.12422 Transcript_5208/m.12422 type:complete len:227 (-) Transcript_5208:183-863(-)
MAPPSLSKYSSEGMDPSRKRSGFPSSNVSNRTEPSCLRARRCMSTMLGSSGSRPSLLSMFLIVLSIVLGIGTNGPDPTRWSLNCSPEDSRIIRVGDNFSSESARAILGTAHKAKNAPPKQTNCETKRLRCSLSRGCCRSSSAVSMCRNNLVCTFIFDLIDDDDDDAFGSFGHRVGIIARRPASTLLVEKPWHPPAFNIVIINSAIKAKRCFICDDSSVSQRQRSRR